MSKDRRKSIRAHALVGLGAAALCGAFALRVFFIMFGPTHSFATAMDLWKQDRGARIAVAALLVLTLGALLALARLRRAESWTQLSRMDRVLAILGIIPASVVYYPIVATATLIGMGLFFVMMMYVTFVRRVESLVRRKSRNSVR